MASYIRLALIGLLLVKAWACSCGQHRDVRHHRFAYRNSWFFRIPQFRIHCDRCGETTDWMNSR